METKANKVFFYNAVELKFGFFYKNYKIKGIFLRADV